MLQKKRESTSITGSVEYHQPADLIRGLELPEDAEVIVLGDTAYDAAVVHQASEDRVYTWIVPPNHACFLTGGNRELTGQLLSCCSTLFPPVQLGTPGNISESGGGDATCCQKFQKIGDSPSQWFLRLVYTAAITKMHRMPIQMMPSACQHQPANVTPQ